MNDASTPPPMDYAAARDHMVDGQVRPNKVIDPRIIRAMRTLPRERFLPPQLASLAYADEDVPLPNGRALMEPMVIARLVQLLRVRGATVVGIASPANHDWLRGLGVTPVSYGDGLAKRIKAAAPDGVDAFIDLFGPDYVRLAVELGVPRERIETIIAFEAAEEYGVKAEGSTDATTTEVLAEMAQLVGSGRIELPIAATYRLEQVREAFLELEKRHTRGKIVLIP